MSLVVVVVSYRRCLSLQESTYWQTKYRTRPAPQACYIYELSFLEYQSNLLWLNDVICAPSNLPEIHKSYLQENPVVCCQNNKSASCRKSSVCRKCCSHIACKNATRFVREGSVCFAEFWKCFNASAEWVLSCTTLQEAPERPLPAYVLLWHSCAGSHLSLMGPDRDMCNTSDDSPLTGQEIQR